MKYIILLFLFIITNLSLAEEIRQYQVGVGSAFSLKSWAERPEQYKEKDVRPPPANLSFGVLQQEDAKALALKTNLSFLDSNTRFLYLSPSLGYKFSFVQVIGGLEAVLNSFSNDSKYKKSAFDSDMIGAFIGATSSLWTIDFHALFYVRKVGETEIAGNEGVVTKMAHQKDTVQKYGALWKIQKFAIAGEFAIFQYGETTIVSREFFYRIEKNTLYRGSFGGGIVMGDFELWGKVYQFKNPDDQLAIYSQSPSFVPDYTLSESSLFLELIWKI